MALSADQEFISGGAGGAAAYSFTCEKDQGALLVLESDARTEYCEDSPILKRWIVDNYKKWYKFAEKKGYEIGDELKGPIFVYGWVKTSGWGLAIWRTADRSSQLTVDLNAGENANVGISFAHSETRATGVIHRTGPNHEESVNSSETTKNQCVFLLYYKVKERLIFPKVMKGGAGPHNLPDPDMDDTHDILTCPKPAKVCYSLIL